MKLYKKEGNALLLMMVLGGLLPQFQVFWRNF